MKKRNNKTLWIVIGIVILLLIFIIGFFAGFYYTMANVINKFSPDVAHASTCGSPNLGESRKTQVGYWTCTYCGSGRAGDFNYCWQYDNYQPVG